MAKIQPKPAAARPTEEPPVSSEALPRPPLPALLEPPVLTLGLNLVATMKAYTREDEAALAVYKRGEASPYSPHDERKASLSDRDDIVRDLIPRTPARTLADAAVQCAVAADLRKSLEDCHEMPRKKDSEVVKLLLAIERLLVSALPIIAQEAGIDMEAMGWSHLVGSNAAAFGWAEHAAAPEPSPDADLIRACEEHVVNLKAYNESGNDLEPEDDPLWAAYELTRDAVSRARPQTIAGMLAKARAAKQEALTKRGEYDPLIPDVANWAWDLVNDHLRFGPRLQLASSGEARS